MLKYCDHKIAFSEVPDEISLAINFSNCHIRCPGCHSRYLWDDIGEVLTFDKLDELIIHNKGITCVCFMGHGGLEGFMSVLNYCKFIKEHYSLKTCIYTGYVFKDIHKFQETQVDYLKTGAYIEKLGGLTSPLTNQRFYKIIHKNNLNFAIEITDIFWKHHKIIPRFPYFVSDSGEVYNLLTKKKLKPVKNQKGYLKVWLSLNGHRYMKFVHRLVAECFLPNYSNTKQVNHIDEDKTNNNVSNLEMCDATYNNNYGNRTAKSIESHKLGRTRKNVVQLSLDGAYITTYPSAGAAGRAIGKSHNLIRLCCKGGVTTKERGFCPITTAYGYKWKFEDDYQSENV